MGSSALGPSWSMHIYYTYEDYRVNYILLLLSLSTCTIQAKEMSYFSQSHGDTSSRGAHDGKFTCSERQALFTNATESMRIKTMRDE